MAWVQSLVVATSCWAKKKKRKEKFTRHPKTHVGVLVWKDKCNVIMFEVYNRPSQNRGLSLRSYFLQGDIFLNKQCPIFRKTMSPSHSLGCPLHPPEHLKQSQESKRRPGKGEKFLPSFQTLPPFPFPGHSPACPRCVQKWAVSARHHKAASTPPPPECANKSRIRSRGVITSELRSWGSFRDWKNLRVISGHIAKAKALKSGNCTYWLMEDSRTRTHKALLGRDSPAEPHPSLEQGQHRKGIRK